MGTASKLKKIQSETKSISNRIETINNEIIADKKRVVETYRSANIILGDIDEKFQKAT